MRDQWSDKAILDTILQLKTAEINHVNKLRGRFMHAMLHFTIAARLISFHIKKLTFQQYSGEVQIPNNKQPPCFGSAFSAFGSAFSV